MSPEPIMNYAATPGTPQGMTLAAFRRPPVAAGARPRRAGFARTGFVRPVVRYLHGPEAPRRTAQRWAEQH